MCQFKNNSITNKKISNIKIFFCASNSQVPIALTLVRSLKKNFIIVTESYDLHKFFIKFYPKSKIILFKCPKSILNINPITIITNVYFNYLLKKKINFFFSKYINNDVFFFKGAFPAQMAYALRILHSRNNMYFIPENFKVQFIFKKKFPTLKIFLYNIYLKMMYRLDCYPVSVANTNFCFLYTNNFYRSISAKKKTIEVNVELLKKLKKKNLNIKNKKILLLSSCEAIEEGVIEKNQFELWIDKWTKIIKPTQVLFKTKRHSDKKYLLENLFTEIPPEWPADLLVHEFDTVIGYCSSTLYQAANAGCKSISLLNLLQKNKASTNYIVYKKYMIANLHKNKKILFPKSWEEFEIMYNST